MTIKKLAGVIILLLIILAVCGLFATLFLSEFHTGLSKIKKIDKKYNFSLKEYSSDFTQVANSPSTIEDITLMSNEFKELKENSENEALLRYLNFRISLLEAEMYYKLAHEIGNKGEVVDGFGCKDKPFILEATSFKNMSAQSGYVAVEHLKGFFEEYPKEAAFVELSKSTPVFLNASFSEIERKAGSTIRFINNVCPD